MKEFDLNAGLIQGMCSYLAGRYVPKNAKVLIKDIEKKLEAEKNFFKKEQ